MSVQNELPRGTVTFLFTDIQGSTNLWQQDQAGMAAAVNEHLAILEEAVSANRGRRFKTIGDAIQVAFPTAPDAVRAAVAAQRALVAKDWGSLGPLRVRMALHTDEAEPDGEDYPQVPGLNLLARIGAAGHGQQILLSAATQELVRGDVPDQGRLIDLGDHRFRGFPHLERVYQLAVPGLPVDFPRLTMLPPDWPAPSTELIGRENAVEEVRDLLQSERLVTLFGAPGVGKSRLALEAAEGLAEEFPDGVFLVELVSIPDPDLVPAEIARRLGVAEDASRTPQEALIDHLKRRSVLLVLDNFEHVLPAVKAVDELLETCRNIRVLVTSRVVLNIIDRGEYRYTVEPLAIPELTDLPATEVFADIPSVALFLAEVRRAKPSFRLMAEHAEAIATICSQLDGLPLAIKLAAPWISMYEPHVLAKKLERQLPMLEEGGPDLDPRHRTMRGAVAWSYNLLAPDQQAMFRLVSVFRGPFSERTAEKIFQANPELRRARVDRGLKALVDRSLIRAMADQAEPRFSLLAVIREYGEELRAKANFRRERNDAGKLCRIWYQSQAQRASQARGAERGRLVDLLETEIQTILWVLETYSEQEDFSKLLELSMNLRPLWDRHRHAEEGIRWLVLGASNALETPPHLRADALRSAGNLALSRGDHVRAETLHEQALDLFRELEDKSCTAGQLRRLGDVAQLRGQFQRAEYFHQMCLTSARELGLRGLEADCLGGLGNAANKMRDYARAKSLYEESLQLSRELGDDSGVATVLSNLGIIAMELGEYDRAEQLLHEALPLHRHTGSSWNEANTLGLLGGLALDRGNLQEAEAHYLQALALSRRIEARDVEADQLGYLGNLAYRQGDNERAKLLLEQSLSWARELQDHQRTAKLLDDLAKVSRCVGREQEAVHWEREARKTRQRLEQDAPNVTPSWDTSESGVTPA
jgi:predicted ATPase/class 3 adenylate cyclase/Tfp pilus assembly protein PilF